MILLLLTARLFLYACLFLYRDLFYSSLPQALESLQAALTPLARVNMLLEEHGIPFPDALQGYSPLSLFNTLFGSFMDVLEFFATPKSETIRFSDVIKFCVSLGTGEVKVKDAEGGQPLRGGRLMLGWKDARWVMPSLSRIPEDCISNCQCKNRPNHRIFCSLWNACVVLSIAWFIASIEFTIRWNNIRNVNTIDATGQLIPFIIGCVSASQVVKKLILLALAEVS